MIRICSFVDAGNVFVAGIVLAKSHLVRKRGIVGLEGDEKMHTALETGKGSDTMLKKTQPWHIPLPTKLQSRRRIQPPQYSPGWNPNGESTTEEAIRRCAYRKWKTAGKPNGDGVLFWLEAERELAQTK
jgi:hypothetical protein